MKVFGSWSQVIRRVLQLSSLFFIIYTALGSPWRNYKIAYNNARLVAFTEGPVWASLYDLNDQFLGWFGESSEVSLNLIGIPWASTVFGIESADPILVMGNIAATGTVTVGLLLAALTPVMIAVIAGRFFCSHLCPARLLFEIGEFARRGLRRVGLAPFELKTNRRFGGWVLLGGLLASFFGGSIVWLFILPYVGISATILLLVAEQTISILALSMVVWLFIDIALAPGFFCNNLCPTGFTLTQLGRFRIWRLKTTSSPEPCPQNCRACERICPYNISSKNGATDLGCDSCGRCVSACPSQRLQRGFARPLLVLIAMLATTFSMNVDAFAHHNKGLPHYGYFENYPQTPTEEYVIIDGRWEMGATVFNFQGYNLRQTSDTPNDVKIYLYIYDLKNDRNYIDRVDFQIRERGGDVIAEYLRSKVDEEAVYSTREHLPHSGDYEIVARIPGEAPIVLPFHIDLQDGLNYTLIFGVGTPLVLLLGLAFVGRSRRRRR